MGCVQSKKDSGDIHPNVFRVVNIDESGTNLWSGQLEITDSELVLYREGREATTWPLRCLRRYGFDGEIFSFESGRRCATGEGIYAFRCRRAGMLFRTLQQNIQLRNMVSESLPFQLPANMLPGTAASLPRSLSGHPVSTRRASEVGEIGMETPPPTAARPTISPRSFTNTIIREVMPLFSTVSSDSPNQITNFYQKENFRTREYNNNRPGREEHSYSNDFNRDLAVLRNTLKKESVINTMKDMQEEQNMLKSVYVNETISSSLNQPLSPTANDKGEHYARLAHEYTNNRVYMNIPQDASYGVLANHFTFSDMPAKEEINTYVNVNLGEVQQGFQKNHQHVNTDLKFTNSVSCESSTEPGVNYAVLDMEPPVSPEAPPSIPAPPRLTTQHSLDSPANTPTMSVGYTTIDFDKTVALTSVAAGTEVDTDGSRKARNNSINVNSPSGVDKNKLL